MIKETIENDCTYFICNEGGFVVGYPMTSFIVTHFESACLNLEIGLKRQKIVPQIQRNQVSI